MEKMEIKERLPFSHGTAAAISLILFKLFVVLGLYMHPPPGVPFFVSSLFPHS